MNDQRDDSDRAGLARSLLVLRENAGLSQTQLGELTGLSQSQISRAERDRRLLSPEQVRNIAEACSAEPTERDRLVQLTQAAARQYVDARAILQRGAITFQERVAKFEEDSSLVRAYQPGMVLGQLQSANYARTVFRARAGRRDEEVERLVAQRQSRTARLRDPVRRWELIQTEGALTWCLGSPAVMIDQIRHMIEISTLPNVHLSVVPAFTPANFLAHHGFHIYDGDAVQVGTANATALLSDRDDVRAYAELFERISAVAVYGDAARDVLRRVLAAYEAKREPV